jgi:hypothetical protein
VLFTIAIIYIRLNIVKSSSKTQIAAYLLYILSSGGGGGIGTVVVEREVRVGERWYVSCF